MQTLFTERHAIELAYKNLEDAKINRREEMRADLEKIDAREQHILERLQVLDVEQPLQEQPGANFTTLADQDRIINGGDVWKAINPHMVQAANEVIDRIQTDIEPKKPKADPKKPKAGKKPKAKQLSEKDGAALLVNILEAAGGEVNMKYIAEQIEKETGIHYANPHGAVKRWMDHSGGKIQKIGTKYSIR